MNKPFDIRDYNQLAKKQYRLEKCGLSLYDENLEEYVKLSTYQIIIEDQIYYNSRNKYFSLITDYRSKKIDTIRFISEFFKLFRADRDSFELIESKLSNYSIDVKSNNFSTLITRIFEDCDVSLDGSDGITEKQFRDSIEKAFSKMQKYNDN